MNGHEQGVEITVEPRGPEGGAFFLKRIRFSPRLFSEASATAWWTANKHAVVRQYGLVPSTEGSGVQADLDSPIVRWVQGLNTVHCAAFFL